MIMKKVESSKRCNIAAEYESLEMVRGGELRLKALDCTLSDEDVSVEHPYMGG